MATGASFGSGQEGSEFSDFPPTLRGVFHAGGDGQTPPDNDGGSRRHTHVHVRAPQGAGHSSVEASGADEMQIFEMEPKNLFGWPKYLLAVLQKFAALLGQQRDRKMTLVLNVKPALEDSVWIAVSEACAQLTQEEQQLLIDSRVLLLNVSSPTPWALEPVLSQGSAANGAGSCDDASGGPVGVHKEGGAVALGDLQAAGLPAGMEEQAEGDERGSAAAGDVARAHEQVGDERSVPHGAAAAGDEQSVPDRAAAGSRDRSHAGTDEERSRADETTEPGSRPLGAAVSMGEGPQHAPSAHRVVVDLGPPRASAGGRDRGAELQRWVEEQRQRRKNLAKELDRHSIVLHNQGRVNPSTIGVGFWTLDQVDIHTTTMHFLEKACEAKILSGIWTTFLGPTDDDVKCLTEFFIAIKLFDSYNQLRADWGCAEFARRLCEDFEHMLASFFHASVARLPELQPTAARVVASLILLEKVVGVKCMLNSSLYQALVEEARNFSLAGPRPGLLDLGGPVENRNWHAPLKQDLMQWANGWKTLHASDTLMGSSVEKDCMQLLVVSAHLQVGLACREVTTYGKDTEAWSKAMLPIWSAFRAFVTKPLSHFVADHVEATCSFLGLPRLVKQRTHARALCGCCDFSEFAEMCVRHVFLGAHGVVRDGSEIASLIVTHRFWTDAFQQHPSVLHSREEHPDFRLHTSFWSDRLGYLLAFHPVLHDELVLKICKEVVFIRPYKVHPASYTVKHSWQWAVLEEVLALIQFCINVPHDNPWRSIIRQSVGELVTENSNSKAYVGFGFWRMEHLPYHLLMQVVEPEAVDMVALVRITASRLPLPEQRGEALSLLSRRFVALREAGMSKGEGTARVLQELALSFGLGAVADLLRVHGWLWSNVGQEWPSCRVQVSNQVRSELEEGTYHSAQWTGETTKEAQEFLSDVAREVFHCEQPAKQVDPRVMRAAMAKFCELWQTGAGECRDAAVSILADQAIERLAMDVNPDGDLHFDANSAEMIASLWKEQPLVEAFSAGRRQDVSRAVLKLLVRVQEKRLSREEARRMAGAQQEAAATLLHIGAKVDANNKKLLQSSVPTREELSVRLRQLDAEWDAAACFRAHLGTLCAWAAAVTGGSPVPLPDIPTRKLADVQRGLGDALDRFSLQPWEVCLLSPLLDEERRETSARSWFLAHLLKSRGRPQTPAEAGGLLHGFVQDVFFHATQPDPHEYAKTLFGLLQREACEKGAGAVTFDPQGEKDRFARLAAGSLDAAKLAQGLGFRENAGEWPDLREPQGFAERCAGEAAWWRTAIDGVRLCPWLEKLADIEEVLGQLQLLDAQDQVRQQSEKMKDSTLDEEGRCLRAREFLGEIDPGLHLPLLRDLAGAGRGIEPNSILDILRLHEIADILQRMREQGDLPWLESLELLHQRAAPWLVVDAGQAVSAFQHFASNLVRSVPDAATAIRIQEALRSVVLHTDSITDTIAKMRRGADVVEQLCSVAAQPGAPTQGPVQEGARPEQHDGVREDGAEAGRPLTALHGRVMDIELDNTPDFAAIKGVMKTARLSVEDAAVATGLEYMDADGYLALEAGQRFSKDDEHGLDQDEAGALNLYTRESELYKQMNTRLRDRDRKKLLPFFPLLRLLFEAKMKLPPFVGNVWRGVDKNLKGSYVPGAEFYWWSFSSTTKKLDATEDFLGQAGKTLFSIEVQDGRDIARYSFFDGKEEEVLLFPGTKLRVVAVMDVAVNVHMVQLKEIAVKVKLVQ